MANRNPMDFNGKLIPVDIEIPATVMVRVEKRCWNCDSVPKRCSSFVIDRVGSTATEAVHSIDVDNGLNAENERRRKSRRVA